MNISQKDLASLMVSLSSLHAWELRCLPCMHTTTGRYVYYAIAKACVNHEEAGVALKALFATNQFTERALRIRMQEMIDKGFLYIDRSDADARARVLMPTEIFISNVEQHANKAKELISENFYIISK